THLDARGAAVGTPDLSSEAGVQTAHLLSPGGTQRGRRGIPGRSHSREPSRIPAGVQCLASGSKARSTPQNPETLGLCLPGGPESGREHLGQSPAAVPGLSADVSQGLGGLGQGRIRVCLSRGIPAGVQSLPSGSAARTMPYIPETLGLRLSGGSESGREHLGQRRVPVPGRAAALSLTAIRGGGGCSAVSNPTFQTVTDTDHI
ncbi:hypothetical protein Celaphus_00006833, partial [Cervus elaphus hippelaphus]